MTSPDRPEEVANYVERERGETQNHQIFPASVYWVLEDRTLHRSERLQLSCMCISTVISQYFH